MSRFSRNNARRMRANRRGENSSLATESDTNDGTSLDVDSSTFLTSSPGQSTTIADSDGENRVTRNMIEKKQLLHDLELLRIELSQKNLIIDNMNAEHLSKVDELEEKLSDSRHQKQMLQARLESQLKLQSEESKGRLERMRKELQIIMKRQQDLEIENVKLQEKTGDFRQNFDNLELSDEKYLELKSTDIEQLGLKDLVAVKIYEASHSLKIECDSLQRQVEILTQDLHSREEEVAHYCKEAEQERNARIEVEVRAQRLSLQVEELRTKTDRGDYKSMNFDQVRSNRDALDREVTELKKSHLLVETSLTTKMQKLEELQNEMQATKQSHALLKQDKEYLNRQLQDLSSRCSLAEEKLEQTTLQLNEAKQAREAIYEKYISVREQYKSEYEMKLKGELDLITAKTNKELDGIRGDTKEMFERENRNLRDARDTAVSEKERAVHAEREMAGKYEKLLSEFRYLQISTDSKQSELQNELKLKQFEIDRLQMLHDETTKNLKQSNLELDKCQKKNEVLSKEFYALQNTCDKQVTQLESRCKAQHDKLAVYERLENELDNVIMQAAEVENESDAERVLFSYGYGANVPSTAKRRMQQSVHLARRVLQLERANTSLRNELDREVKKKDQLAQELSGATDLLNEAQQPYNYLIDSIRSRDSHNQALKEQNSLMEKDIKRLKDEKDDLNRTRNEMAADLERLLNQREEMAVMKQVVLGLHGSHSSHHNGKGRPGSRVTRTATAVHGPESRLRTSAFTQEVVNTPEPTVIAKAEHPAWYRKLKQRNLSGETKPIHI